MLGAKTPHVFVPAAFAVNRTTLNPDDKTASRSINKTLLFNVGDVH
jgi:hypothetical protein